MGTFPDRTLTGAVRLSSERLPSLVADGGRVPVMRLIQAR
jgi:hypothetical protein